MCWKNSQISEDAFPQLDLGGGQEVGERGGGDVGVLVQMGKDIKLNMFSSQ